MHPAHVQVEVLWSIIFMHTHVHGRPPHTTLVTTEGAVGKTGSHQGYTLNEVTCTNSSQ